MGARWAIFAITWCAVVVEFVAEGDVVVHELPFAGLGARGIRDGLVHAIRFRRVRVGLAVW